ncbi:microprocessor complex subunit DGCR8 [Amyelois transitella]|uniref:microprocessor complex subunit DGCR8 n=1 Tax=Amyelois transitella TaxID=680683 RepID=UPI00067AFB08|nr:microprocessor complex subunit DGCR8 [Amyelois transitella]
MSEDSELPPTKRARLDKDAEIDFSVDTTETGNAFEQFGNYVNQEELERLREFKVLDEVHSNDEDSNDEDSDSSEGTTEVPEEEIEQMLEENLPENFKGAPKPKEKPFVTRQKIVLEEKGINLFEVLPLDWMMVRHYSGMPVYMHRGTRVCTLSKPYSLGKGNTRRHDIPISAIPCLAYRTALKEEEKQKEIDRKIEEQIKNGTWVNNIKKNNKSKKNKENNDKNTNSQSKTDDNDKESSQAKVGKCPFSKKGETSINNDETKGNKSVNDDVQSEQNNDIPKDKHEDENCSVNDSNQQSIDKITDDVQNKNKEVETKNEVQNKDEEVQNKDGNVQHDNVTNHNKNEDAQNENENTAVKEQEADKENNGEDDENEEEIPLNRQPVVLPGGIVMPPPRVETVSTSWKTQQLTHEQVNDYCKNLFKFKTVNIMHFKRWADRRKYTKARKALQYPALPEGTKLITIPAQPANGQENGKTAKRDCVMNMNGRSYLSVFHEYVRRALQKQPVYEFKQLENASTPYQATVYIGGMQYGVGQGSSKRQAKSAAARASIHILIPEMREELDADAPPKDAKAAEQANDPDFSFFDCVGIEDPRITEFCAATCEPSPHAILRTCLLRNFGAGDRHIATEMKKLEFQNIELTMKVGKHTATVVCKNKKTAKQRASQAILQALHPHVRSWGSLLRLYGSRSVKSCKEKKLEEQQITLLQDRARHNEPNYAVLEKLRHEMRKLRERDEAVVPIGTLVVKDDLPTHSGSNLNNVEL